MRKWLIGIAGLVVLLLVVGFFWNRIMVGAIEEAGTQALGVRMSLSGILLRPLVGTAYMFGLEIDNPNGFKQAHFASLEGGTIHLDTSTLFDDPIMIERIELNDLDMVLERAGRRTNYGVILENMGPTDPEASGPTVIVKELLIHNTRAKVDLGMGAETEVTIPEIRMTNVGGPQDPVELAQLTRMVTIKVLTTVATDAAGLPLSLTTDLGRALGGVGVSGFKIGKETGGKMAEQAGEGARKAFDKMFGDD